MISQTPYQARALPTVAPLLWSVGNSLSKLGVSIFSALLLFLACGITLAQPLAPETRIEVEPSDRWLFHSTTEAGVHYTLQSTGTLSSSTTWTSAATTLQGLGSTVSIVLVDPASPSAPSPATFYYLEPLGADGTAVSWSSGGNMYRQVIPEAVTALAPSGHLTTANQEIFWKKGSDLQADPYTLNSALPEAESNKLEEFRTSFPTMLAQPPNAPVTVKLGAPLENPPGQRQFWRLAISTPDSDGDGYSDYDELTNGLSTNPFSDDTDGDILPDAEEIAEGTNPAGNDSNENGIPDNDELTLESESASTSLVKHGFDSFIPTTPPKKFLFQTVEWNPNYIGTVQPFDPDITELGNRITVINRFTGGAVPFSTKWGTLDYYAVTVTGTPTPTSRTTAMPWNAPGWDPILGAPGTLVGAATASEVLSNENTTPFFKQETLSTMPAFTGTFTTVPKESIHALSANELNYSASKMQYRWKFAGPSSNVRNIFWSETFIPDNPNDPGLTGIPASQITTVQSYTGTAVQTDPYTVSVAERFPTVNGKIVVESLPVNFSISHPEVTGSDPPQYSVNADLASVQVTAAIGGVADGSIIEWSIVQGNGTLSESETTTVDGFASTTLTTSTVAGTTYKVKARVKKLLVPAEDEEDPPVEFDPGTGGIAGLELTTGSITVVPGFPASITVAREEGTAGSTTTLQADGTGDMILVATFKDQFDQPVAEHTPVVWHLEGLGEIVPNIEATAADGKASAVLVAGDVPADQKVRIEAGGFEVVETVQNLAIQPSLSSSAPTLDIATGQSATLTANLPNVSDGTKIRWFTSKGQILDAETVVQNGQAVATLKAGGGRIGTALVTLSVGGVLKGTEVAFTSSSPISVEADNPVIVGDATADGTYDVVRLDGTTQAVPYVTNTPVRVKAPGYSGQTATVLFGQYQPTYRARYLMDEISGGQTPDSVGSFPATVSSATLDTVRKYEGLASLYFDGVSAELSIADSPALRIEDDFKVSAWIYADATGGSIVAKSGEYELSIDNQGRLTFTVTTSSGAQTVTGPTVAFGQWYEVSGQYGAGGILTVSVGGESSTSQATGTPVQGTYPVLVGTAFQGWVDSLAISVGRQFTQGTGLAVSGLNGSNQVVLDGSGEATVNLSAAGMAVVNDTNPVLNVGVKISINPDAELEDTVQVVTRKAYAVLDATMGEVKISVASQNGNLSGSLKNEVVARALMEFKRTGQRSASIPFEPTGTIIERQQYGFRASLWLEESVEEAQKVKLILENTDRLNLTAEEKANLQEQVTRILIESVDGASDAGTQERLAGSYAGLINTLADLSEQESFLAFTTKVDGREFFIDLAEAHEEFGPGIVFDLSRLAQADTGNSISIQRILAILKPIGDRVTGVWQQQVFDSTETFLRNYVDTAVDENKLTVEEALSIGYGWGLCSEVFAVGQAANVFAASRTAEGLIATVIAANQGSEEAKTALAEMIPVWGLKVMNDESITFAQQGLYFDAGKKSAELTVATVGTAVVVGTMVKGGISMLRASKAVSKPKLAGPPRIPVTLGRADPSYYRINQYSGKLEWDYRSLFFDNNKQISLAERPSIEVHHAVPQEVLKLYNTLFSEAEIHSLENLRGLRIGYELPDGRTLHRRAIHRDYWKDFLDEHPFDDQSKWPTRQEILDHATGVDDIYGNLFIPEVR